MGLRVVFGRAEEVVDRKEEAVGRVEEGGEAKNYWADYGMDQIEMENTTRLNSSACSMVATGELSVPRSLVLWLGFFLADFCPISQFFCLYADCMAATKKQNLLLIPNAPISQLVRGSLHAENSALGTVGLFGLNGPEQAGQFIGKSALLLSLARHVENKSESPDNSRGWITSFDSPTSGKLHFCGV
jgi:hypothetical protein